ncbi:hypothetical protein FQR65_LT02223 [Abscondita terminalis]|nr:hypothetical protein FQR65_LT02223 [Abscondita terminalis]
MFTLVLLFVAVSAACGQRIVGGNDADIKDYPYMAALEVDGRYVCAGVIVSPIKVVTVAGCSRLHGSADDLKVRAGSALRENGGQLRSVSKIISHPLNIVMVFDVSVWILDEPLEINDQVRAIEIGSDEDVPIGAHANFTGWGVVRDDELAKQLQVVPMVKSSGCADFYGLIFFPFASVCYGGEIGRDACLKDLGGPVVFNGKLIGLYSYGGGLCVGHVPLMFTKLEAYLNFINNSN